MSKIIIWPDTRMEYTNLAKQFIEEKFSNDEVIVTTDRNVVLDNIADTEILVSTPYDREVVEKGTNLKWIQALGAGYNHYDIEYLKSRNIILSRIVGAHNIHMAEMAIMGMVMLAREMNLMNRAQNDRVWYKELDQERIFEKTLVLIGCGAIGTTMAEYAKRMGMNVIGVGRSIQETNETFDEFYSIDNIATVLPKADYVLTMLPSTKETYHFMSEEKFRLMKPSAFFLNLGRGDLVSSDVMYKVLSENIIKGAFLDVFDVEPLPSYSPLWGLRNLIITPHSGGYYKHYLHETFKCFYKNYCLYKNGDELYTRVDNLD